MLSGGGARCTGENQFGQLGDHDLPGDSLRLVQVFGLRSGVTSLYTSEDDSCAFQGAQIVCWGGAGWSRQRLNGPSTEGIQLVPLIHLVTPAAP